MVIAAVVLWINFIIIREGIDYYNEEEAKAKIEVVDTLKTDIILE